MRTYSTGAVRCNATKVKDLRASRMPILAYRLLHHVLVDIAKCDRHDKAWQVQLVAILEESYTPNELTAVVVIILSQEAGQKVHSRSLLMNDPPK